jgi:hypothetical protein
MNMTLGTSRLPRSPRLCTRMWRVGVRRRGEIHLLGRFKECSPSQTPRRVLEAGARRQRVARGQLRKRAWRVRSISGLDWRGPAKPALQLAHRHRLVVRTCARFDYTDGARPRCAKSGMTLGARELEKAGRGLRSSSLCSLRKPAPSPLGLPRTVRLAKC